MNCGIVSFVNTTNQSVNVALGKGGDFQFSVSPANTPLYQSSTEEEPQAYIQIPSDEIGKDTDHSWTVQKISKKMQDGFLNGNATLYGIGLEFTAKATTASGYIFGNTTYIKVDLPDASGKTESITMPSTVAPSDPIVVTIFRTHFTVTDKVGNQIFPPQS